MANRRLCRGCMLLMLCMAMIYPASAAPPVPAGRVEFAIGSPTATGQDKRARPLSRGASVFEGDLVHTGAGRVQLRFTDGGFMSLQPQTQFKVEQYRYSGKADGTEKGIFNLVKGGMRTITGLIGKNENKNYRVHTKVATIGVRGTEYSLNLDAGLHGSVASGQIDVCSAGGCSPFARGESFVVPHAAARPVMTLRKASLPAPQPGEHQHDAPSQEQGDKPPAQQTASAPPPEGAPPPDGSPPPEGAPPPKGSPPPGGTASPGGQESAAVAGNLPPPPPPFGTNTGFVQGNATDSTGTSAAFKLTGTHFLAIATARYQGPGNPLFGIEAPYMGSAVLDSNGYAQRVGPWILDSSTKGGSNGYSAGGEGFLNTSGLAFHYAIGYPTLWQDIQSLQINSPVIAYTHLAGSNPTGFFGPTGPLKEDPIGRFLSGSMSVNLATSTTQVQMNLEIANQVVSVNGPNLGMTLTPNNPSATFGGACSTGSQCRIDGFLVGPMAQGTMLVYEFGGHNMTTTAGPTTLTARGMATFVKQQ